MTAEELLLEYIEKRVSQDKWDDAKKRLGFILQRKGYEVQRQTLRKAAEMAKRYCVVDTCILQAEAILAMMEADDA